ncbi:MAG: carboxypeptidase regulatory-like domain-containing protein [Acidobacteria bacterium]|nr:carboxypeptidase regulatory-like domain-containing protein [Acidobacteriota bacterium]
MFFKGFLLYLLFTLSPGEATSTINGTVVDSNKKPVSGAEVFLLTGSQLKAITDANGTFSLENLEPGDYAVAIVGNGLAPWIRRGIRIESGQKATLEVMLSPGVEDRFKVKFMEPRQKDIDSFDPELESFNEPSFCSKILLERKTESYRFLWMRTFHHPVLIQLIKIGPGKVSLIYKELNGMGGYAHGRLIEQKTVDVYKELGGGEQPKDMVQSAVNFLFQDAIPKIWEQPYEFGQTMGIDGSILIGLDGATWTVEAIKDGRCHLATRWSPESNDPVRQFAETLINLSGKRFYHDEFY